MSVLPIYPPFTGLQFTNNSTATTVNCGSGAISDNIAAGTLLFWAKYPSVANALRSLVGKAGGTQAINSFRRGANGTQVRFEYGRSTSVQFADTPSGTLVVDKPICLGFKWDIAGSPVVYTGTLVSSMAVGTTSPANGSGTHDDSAGSWRFGYNGTTVSDGFLLYIVAIFNRNLTDEEVRSWQFNPLKPINGLVGLWRPGSYGGVTVPDESGFGNHGLITSAVNSGDYLVLPNVEMAVAPGLSIPILH